MAEGISGTSRVLASKQLRVAGALLVIAAAVTLGNLRELDARNYFFADDWGWFYKANFTGFGEIFHILPNHIYNDRPVGALVIKILYEIFGLDYVVFQNFQFGIHVFNCVLTFFIARRYAHTFGAMLSAILAGLWFSSNEAVFWTGAIFDLLGATFSLLTILLWQKSHDRKSILLIAGLILCYALAVRTKEFAIGLPAILFLMSVMLEKQSLVGALRRLAPILVVFAILAARYVQLYLDSRTLMESPGNAYALQFGAFPGALAYYASQVSYYTTLGLIIPAVIFVSLTAPAAFIGRYRRILTVFLFSFVVLLGPTLLLGNQRFELYLYAPHFMLAIAIGALVPPNGSWLVRAGVAAICLVIVIVPLNSRWRENILIFTDQKTAIYKTQMKEISRHTAKIEPGSQVFISGLDPYFNLFSFRAGDVLRILVDEKDIKVVIEKPKEELLAEFCAASGHRLFFAYENDLITDQTAMAEAGC